MNDNVTLIPARRRAGNRVVKKISLSSESQRIAELVLTAMSRPEVMKYRFNIIQIILNEIRNGNWQVFMLMTVSQGPIQKSDKDLMT